MTKTKRSFLYAGSILGIIGAAFMLLISAVFFYISPLMSEDFVFDIYWDDVENYTPLDSNGDLAETKQDTFSFMDNKTGDVYAVKDINAVSKLAKTAAITIATFLLAIGAAILIFSILVIRTAVKGSDKKWPIITLLILSAIMGNMLTMAFMIVALCIKNKPPIEEVLNSNNNVNNEDNII